MYCTVCAHKPPSWFANIGTVLGNRIAYGIHTCNAHCCWLSECEVTLGGYNNMQGCVESTKNVRSNHNKRKIKIFVCVSNYYKILDFLKGAKLPFSICRQ